MSRDSDIAVLGRIGKYKRQMTREQFGVSCPRCAEERPKANATILLPGQRCFDGYRDPRPHLSKAQHDVLWEEAARLEEENERKFFGKR